MKKIILILITVITLTGCYGNINTKVDNTPLSDVININIPYSTGNINVYKFNYKNHHYIYFAPYANLAEGSIVHDPDCPLP